MVSMQGIDGLLIEGGVLRENPVLAIYQAREPLAERGRGFMLNTQRVIRRSCKNYVILHVHLGETTRTIIKWIGRCCRPIHN